MKRTKGFLVALLTLTVTIPAAGQTDGTPNETLHLAADAIGAIDVETLGYSGSGSSYSYGVDAEGQKTREYARVVTYAQDLSYADLSTTVEVTRLVGDPREEVVETQEVDLASPWESQIALWLNPHLFLRKALSEDATVEPETELGVDYQVVRFETPSGHQLSGYIDEENMLRKIRAEIGKRTIEASYRDYEDFGGVRFPTMVVHKEGASPTLILIVKDVHHEGTPA